MHFLTFKRKVKGFVILIFMIFLQFSTFYSFSNFRLVFQQNETIKEQKIDKTLEKSKTIIFLDLKLNILEIFLMIVFLD